MMEEIKEARRSEREAQRREREAQRELDHCQRQTEKANKRARVSNRVMAVAVALSVAMLWSLTDAREDIRGLKQSVSLKEGMLISQNVSIARLRDSVDYERNKAGKLSGRVSVLEDAINSIRTGILTDSPEQCPPQLLRKGAIP